MQTAEPLYPGVVSTTTQTFGGNKTFNGSVGIGSTPSTKLDVYSTTNQSELTIRSNTDVQVGAKLARTIGTPSTWEMYIPQGSTDLRFYNAADRIWITSTGSVGVGITPSTKFHVSGTARFDLGSDATGDLFYRNSSGQLTRLGIGSTNQRLAVSGGLPAWVTPTTTSGSTYTPTLTASSNVSTLVAHQCQYMRVGDTVTVSGRADCTNTGTGICAFRITLPIASNFTDTDNNQCAGVAQSVASEATAQVIADTTNDTAFLKYNGTTGLTHQFWFQFTYQLV
jgi:hypothetical protein